MKKFLSILFICISFFLVNTSFAQLRKIPAEVTDNFTEKFPGATQVEWRDKLSGFTASFSVDSVAYVAAFNNKGEWESTEQSIEEEALPQVVNDGFDKSKYADWTVETVSQIEYPNDEIQFKIVVAKGDIKKRNLYFNSEGRLVKDKLTL